MSRVVLTEIDEGTLTQLRDDMKRLRTCGEVILEVREFAVAAPDNLLLDSLAISLECTAIGEAWLPLDEGSAVELLTAVLSRDLAYNSLIVPSEDAHSFVKRFLEHFEGGRRCFTNLSITGEMDCHAPVMSSGSWMPLTTASFDIGVAVIARQRIGLFWVKDGD